MAKNNDQFRKNNEQDTGISTHSLLVLTVLILSAFF